MIKNFIITPNNFKKTENQPTHFLMYKPGKDLKYVKIGAGWKKTNPDGSYYVSFQLNEPSDKYPGAYIEIEDPLSSDPELAKEIEEMKRKNKEAVDDFQEPIVGEIPF